MHGTLKISLWRKLSALCLSVSVAATAFSTVAAVRPAYARDIIVKKVDTKKAPKLAVLPFLPKDRKMAENFQKKPKLNPMCANLSSHLYRTLTERGYTELAPSTDTLKAIADLNLTLRKDKMPDPKKPKEVIDAKTWTLDNVKSIASLSKADYILFPVILKCERRRKSPVPLPSVPQKRCVTLRTWVIDAHNVSDLKKMMEGKEEGIKFFDTYDEKEVKNLAVMKKQFEGKNKTGDLTEEEFVGRLAVDKLSRQIFDYFMRGIGTVTRVTGDKVQLDIGETSGVQVGDDYTFYQIDVVKDKDGRTVYEEYIKVGTGEVAEFVTKTGREKGSAILNVTAKEPKMTIKSKCVAQPSDIPVPPKEERIKGDTGEENTPEKPAVPNGSGATSDPPDADDDPPATATDTQETPVEETANLKEWKRYFQHDAPDNSIVTLTVKPNDEKADVSALPVGEPFKIEIGIQQAGYVFVVEQTPSNKYRLHFPAVPKVDAAKMDKTPYLPLPKGRRLIFEHDSEGKDTLKVFWFKDKDDAEKMLQTLENSVIEENPDKPKPASSEPQPLPTKMATAVHSFEVKPSKKDKAKSDDAKAQSADTKTPVAAEEQSKKP